jgi:polyphenol oxidase
MNVADFILRPDWPAPARVRAAQTLRTGGVSVGAYASLNLGAHVGDDQSFVAENRARLRRSLALQTEPLWLSQAHGAHIVEVDDDSGRVGDGVVTRRAGTVCAILAADCLPVLFANDAGTCVAAAHAGWRGLAAGVLEATVHATRESPECLLAWFGPAIGLKAFEVGAQVRDAFVAHDARAADAFVANARGRWMADLFKLARQRLFAVGLTRIYGGGLCTASDPARFFSHRRDGQSGRMATLIWLEA